MRWSGRTNPLSHCPVLFKKDLTLLLTLSLESFFSALEGSGYFIDLPADKSHASSMLRDLHAWRWVDKLTRASLAEEMGGKDMQRQHRNEPQESQK